MTQHPRILESSIYTPEKTSNIVLCCTVLYCIVSYEIVFLLILLDKIYIGHIHIISTHTVVHMNHHTRHLQKFNM